MARPRTDGFPSRKPNKIRLTDKFVKSAAPGPDRALHWDKEARGLALAVHPGGGKSWKFTYRSGGRLRVLTIGPADAIGAADARLKALTLRVQVANGTDPQAEKRRGAKAETFTDVAARYLEHAKKVNKSWRQADTLVTKNLLPTWGKLRARAITRADVRTIIRGLTEAGSPIMANQVLASASAIFTWAIKEEVGEIAVNPCTGISRNPTTSRERVLAEAEVPKFWAEFDKAGLVRSAALKTILLTGQPPGEVAAMRREHINGSWWELPGKPDHALGWPGTKNADSHRVYLTAPVLALIAEIGEGTTGFAFQDDSSRAKRSVAALDGAMRDASAALSIAAPDKVTPHDLRRTHGTLITSLGFGRDAMNRIQNHKEGGIAGVYDRHGYAKENTEIQEAVTRRILALIGRGAGENVVELQAHKTIAV